jgi:hypothetical protein
MLQNFIHLAVIFLPAVLFCNGRGLKGAFSIETYLQELGSDDVDCEWVQQSITPSTLVILKNY